MGEEKRVFSFALFSSHLLKNPQNSRRLIIAYSAQHCKTGVPGGFEFYWLMDQCKHTVRVRLILTYPHAYLLYLAGSCSSHVHHAYNFGQGFAFSLISRSHPLSLKKRGLDL